MTRDQETKLLEIFEGAWQRIRRVSFAHVDLPEADWDEVRADCLIRVFRGYPEYDPSRPLGCWVRVVVRNCTMNAFRSRFPQNHVGRWKRHLRQPWRLREEPVDPSTELSRQLPVREFYATLRPLQRKIFDLRLDGLDAHRIGRKIKKDRGWVYREQIAIRRDYQIWAARQ